MSGEKATGGVEGLRVGEGGRGDGAGVVADIVLDGGGRFPSAPGSNVRSGVTKGLEVACCCSANGVEGVACGTGVSNKAGVSESEGVWSEKRLVRRLAGVEVKKEVCPS